MATLHVYDLDGTLSTLNNTFQFMTQYCLHSKRKTRYYLYRIVNAILRRVPGPYYRKRRILIYILFHGIHTQSLHQFYKNHYRSMFLASVTPLAKQLDPKQNRMILTGCTEFPARWIAQDLKFPTITCTRFATKNQKITHIEQDTYGQQKAKHFKRPDDGMVIYYTDDLHTELDMKLVVDRIKVIAPEQ